MDKPFTASEVLNKLRERFTSGNSVPVPDVRLTRAEFDALAAHSAQAQPPAASVPDALLRDWFNLLCHAGIDAREEKANNTLHRIMDIAKQVSSEIAKYENAALAAQENSQ